MDPAHLEEGIDRTVKALRDFEQPTGGVATYVLTLGSQGDNVRAYERETVFVGEDLRGGLSMLVGKPDVGVGPAVGLSKPDRTSERRRVEYQVVFEHQSAAISSLDDPPPAFAVAVEDAELAWAEGERIAGLM